jgi:hypothetical protein
MYSEVSLHISGSSKTGIRISCVWNSLYDVRVDSGMRAKADYSVCFAWFGLNRHA